MTVAELIAALKTMPTEARVVIVYDGGACNEDIAMVARWLPDARTGREEAAEVAVGLFDAGSEDWHRRHGRDHPVWPNARRIDPLPPPRPRPANEWDDEEGD